MPPLSRLLVAIDSAAKEHRALTLGLALSRGYGSELIICTVIDRAAVISAASTPDAVYPSVAVVVEEYDAAAEALLNEAASRATAAGARATTKLLDGHPATAIVAFAKENAVDGIVMGTQGRHGLERAFLGSTAEGVLHLTDVPTFLVHFSEASAPAAQEISETTPFERILVALDDSDPADAALTVAMDLSSSTQALLLCCNVIETDDLFDKAVAYGYDPTPMLEELKATAKALLSRKLEPSRQRGLNVDSFVVEGKPPEAILKAAAAHHADLIAIGTHGRRGLKRLFLGSVAESLVRRSDVPVVVVRALKMDALRRDEEMKRVERGHS